MNAGLNRAGIALPGSWREDPALWDSLAQSCDVCGVALTPPFPLGPPCMETFLNKPHASYSAVYPLSSYVRGESGLLLEGTEADWAVHPPAHQAAWTPTRSVNIRGNKGEGWDSPWQDGDRPV